VIEARSGGATTARIVAGHPCRAEVDGDELLVGTEPLVAQVGNSRWSGDAGDPGEHSDGTTLRKDGAAVLQIRDVPGSGERASEPGIDVFDPQGGAILHISGDGAIANARGEIVRRAEPARAAIKIGDAVVTGTSDLALAVLVTAPELIPEVRALAACRRLSIARADPGPAPSVRGN
jgi:hypothetical protein